MKVGLLVLQVAPLSVENSSTPPSKLFSSATRCQNDSSAPVALAGTANPLFSVRSWSATLAASGEKAELVPLCLSLVTVLQPQPPGTQVGTLAVKLPSPDSKA